MWSEAFSNKMWIMDRQVCGYKQLMGEHRQENPELPDPGRSGKMINLVIHVSYLFVLLGNS